VNPARNFDLIVIGTGAAASEAAYKCREAGWTVAVVDSRPFGGTCANRGCDPKKVLVGAAEAVDWARRMAPHGVAASDLRIDWPSLMRFKRSFTDPVPANREQGFQAAGMATFHGVARFTGPYALEVAGQTLSARQFVIGAGAAPAPLHIPGDDLLIDSDHFLELEQLPESIVFVGGGYIAFEFAHLSARAGARVSIVHRGARPLERFEPELVDRLAAHTRALGIELHLGTAVEAVERTAGGFRVRGAGGISAEGALVVHAAGRLPQIEALTLVAAGVDATPHGVTVNEYLQSVSNPRVYAAGDVSASGGPALTPVAGYEGRVVAENLLHGNRRRTEYRGVASAVYTIPPLATTGLTEAEARKQSLDFDVHAADTTGWYSSRRVAEEISGYKTLVERGSGRILGAHVLGQDAPDLVNIFALAIRHGLTADQIKEPLYAYPTHGSNIQYMV
jgi:glutathione reductase (NADPH)